MCTQLLLAESGESGGLCYHEYAGQSDQLSKRIAVHIAVHIAVVRVADQLANGLANGLANESDKHRHLSPDFDAGQSESGTTACHPGTLIRVTHAKPIHLEPYHLGGHGPICVIDFRSKVY